MATLAGTLAAIATQVRTVHEHTAYPNPRSISANHVTIVVASGTGLLTWKGGSEQEWMEQPILKLYAGTSDAPTAYSAIDALLDTIADLFTPTNTTAYTLDGLVDYCQVASYEFDQVLTYAAVDYWGGIIRLAVKRRRFAGSS